MMETEGHINTNKRKNWGGVMLKLSMRFPPLQFLISLGVETCVGTLAVVDRYY